MITVQLLPEEIRSLIESLESERSQYLREYGSHPLSLVRNSAQRAIDCNNELIQRLELSMQQRIAGP